MLVAQRRKAWIKQFEFMGNKKVSSLLNDRNHRKFVTIDDLRQLAEELVSGLKQLSKHKYPLDVRRGVTQGKEVSSMERENDGRQIKAGSRTYFFDIKETKEGKSYLVITESHFKGEGSQRERNRITVFPENLEEFGRVVSEMITKLK